MLRLWQPKIHRLNFSQEVLGESEENWGKEGRQHEKNEAGDHFKKKKISRLCEIKHTDRAGSESLTDGKVRKMGTLLKLLHVVIGGK